MKVKRFHVIGPQLSQMHESEKISRYGSSMELGVISAMASRDGPSVELEFECTNCFML